MIWSFIKLELWKRNLAEETGYMLEEDDLENAIQGFFGAADRQKGGLEQR